MKYWNFDLNMDFFSKEMQFFKFILSWHLNNLQNQNLPHFCCYNIKIIRTKPRNNRKDTKTLYGLWLHLLPFSNYYYLFMLSILHSCSRNHVLCLLLLYNARPRFEPNYTLHYARECQKSSSVIFIDSNFVFTFYMGTN